jgi:hypothetical protein
VKDYFFLTKKKQTRWQMAKFTGQKKDGSIKGIKGLFQLFSSAAMNPRAYVKKTLPSTVTVPLGSQEMEILNVIACRIGAPRKNVAQHILKIGLSEAAAGCGFSFDDEGNIPEEEKKWDLASRTMGLSHLGDFEEEK